MLKTAGQIKNTSSSSLTGAWMLSVLYLYAKVNPRLYMVAGLFPGYIARFDEGVLKIACSPLVGHEFTLSELW